MWQGPVPIGHCHDPEVGSISAAQLTRHLAAHHPDALMSLKGPGCTDPEGWHLHWIVRSLGFSGLNAEELVLHVECAPSPSLFSEIAVDAFDLCLESLSGGALLPATSLPQMSRSTHCASFIHVGCLHSRLSLPEFFGIMLC
jgi:hypothetical protein